MRTRPAVVTLALALALALVASACGDGDSGTSTATTTTPAPSTTRAPATTAVTAPTTTALVVSGPTVSPQVLEGGSEPDRYTYKVAFPQLAGLADAKIQESLNAQIRADVQKVVDEFVAAAKDLGQNPGAGDLRSGLDGEYEQARLDDGLASFRLPI
ncbi:MAG: hypothetical protein QOE93_2433, partial [Actinomycetota bacterium]|nr:hypothetical protein [Actinomycetota bacterium]